MICCLNKVQNYDIFTRTFVVADAIIIGPAMAPIAAVKRVRLETMPVYAGATATCL
jgi:hypothetical protein